MTEPRARIRGIWRWLATFVLAVSLCACSRPPDEEVIRQSLESMQSALEERRPGDFLEHVSDSYEDGHGGDLRELKRMLLFQLARNPDIGVYLTAIEVRLQGDAAEVDMNAGLTGGEGLIPERGRLYRVNTRWRREGGDWLVYRAEWEPLLESTR